MTITYDSLGFKYGSDLRLSSSSKEMAKLQSIAKYCHNNKIPLGSTFRDGKLCLIMSFQSTRRKQALVRWMDKRSFIQG